MKPSLFTEEQRDALQIGFSAPEPFGKAQKAGALFQANGERSDQALFVEVNFRLEERCFACHLVLLLPENEIETVRVAVDRFVESYV